MFWIFENELKLFARQTLLIFHRKLKWILLGFFAFLSHLLVIGSEKVHNFIYFWWLTFKNSHSKWISHFKYVYCTWISQGTFSMLHLIWKIISSDFMKNKNHILLSSLIPDLVFLISILDSKILFWSFSFLDKTNLKCRKQILLDPILSLVTSKSKKYFTFCQNKFTDDMEIRTSFHLRIYKWSKSKIKWNPQVKVFSEWLLVSSRICSCRWVRMIF